MNLAILKKDTDTVEHFILDCVQTGNDYYGSNIKLGGLKPFHWDFIWTIDSDLAGKNREDITPAPTYLGRPVGSREDVDVIVISHIREKYSLNDEMKLLRVRGAEFTEYNNYIENIVSEAKKFKDGNFKK